MAGNTVCVISYGMRVAVAVRRVADCYRPTPFTLPYFKRAHLVYVTTGITLNKSLNLETRKQQSRIHFSRFVLIVHCTAIQKDA